MTVCCQNFWVREELVFRHLQGLCLIHRDNSPRHVKINTKNTFTRVSLLLSEYTAFIPLFYYGFAVSDRLVSEVAMSII